MQKREIAFYMIDVTSGQGTSLAAVLQIEMIWTEYMMA